MKSVIARTGSMPVLPGSPKVSIPVLDSVTTVKVTSLRRSPSFQLQSNGGKRNNNVAGKGIRRAISEAEMIQTEEIEVTRRVTVLNRAGSMSFPARIPEDEYVMNLEVEDRDGGSYGGMWRGCGISVEELGLSGGGGIGIGKVTGGEGSGFSGGYEDRKSISDYYEKMLKSNPGNYLLLRNYGKFLHEVEKDMVKAEVYYGRAILASQGREDGEVFALYGKLIWETQRDKTRAKSYFDQALFASPSDCTVLGSYAQFLWETEEEGEDEEETDINKREVEFIAAMVAAQ